MSNFVDSLNNLANTVAYNNALSTQTNLSVDFINKFGSYSDNFSQITPVGNEKYIWFYVVSAILIFLSVVFYFVKKMEDKEDVENKKPLSEKPVTIIFNITILIMVIFICYSIYRHFFVYKPQYDKWFSSLPNDARNLLASINTVRQTINAINATRPSYPSYQPRTVNTQFLAKVG